MKKKQLTYFIYACFSVLFLSVLSTNAQSQIASWGESDSMPNLTGSPSLSISISPDRTEAVVPAGIFFQHDGTLKDSYYWDFGNGINERGSQASHLYEIPGTYKVKVIRINPETMAWGIDSVDIVINSFTGTTYYIDSLNGNNINAGTSPGSAWKTAGKVASFIRSGNNANVRYLFKRGMIFPVDSSDFVSNNLFFTTSANVLRFGAYANNDGSDDTTLPRPVIKVNSSGITSESFIYRAYGTNNYDAVLSDIHFQGDYVFVAPPNDPLTRQDYNVILGYVIDFKNFTYLRLEISNLKNGVYPQNNSRSVFIHNCNFHHLQATPIYGNVKWYSLRNNNFSYVSQSHMHYLGPNEGVIRENTMKENGMSVDVGRDPWFQTGLRLNSSNLAQVRRVYINRNYITQITGSPLTVGQNNASDPSSSEIVVEENVFSGSTPEVSSSYWEWAPIASFQSVSGLVFRNNALINARAGLSTSRNGTVNQDLNFYNNTFHLTDNNAAAINIAGSSGDVLDFSISQNIFIGTGLPVSLSNSDFEQEMFLSDNVCWNDGGNVELKIGTAYSDITAWNTVSQGNNNKKVDPQLASLNIAENDFILPSNHSAEMTSNLVKPLYDFTGSLRKDGYIGAREYFSETTTIVESITDEIQILARPNPFKEFTVITIPEAYSGKSYTLININGTKVLSGSIQGDIQIKSDQIADGIYLLFIEGIKTIKLIKI